MPPSYELRGYLPEDYDWLYALREQSYKDVVISQFGKWDEDDQRRYYEANWAPERVMLIVSGGTRIGMLSYSVAKGDIYLEEIQISPDHRGQGVGSAILRDLIEEARGSDSSLTLQVLHENRKAMSLYKKIGFKTVRKTDTHFVMSIS